MKNCLNFLADWGAFYFFNEHEQNSSSIQCGERQNVHDRKIDAEDGDKAKHENKTERDDLSRENRQFYWTHYFNSRTLTMEQVIENQAHHHEHVSHLNNA